MVPPVMRWERKRQAIPLLLFFFQGFFFYFIIHLLTLRVKKLRMPPLPTLSLSHPTPSALKRPSFRQCLPGIPAAGRGHNPRRHHNNQSSTRAQTNTLAPHQTSQYYQLTEASQKSNRISENHRSS